MQTPEELTEALKVLLKDDLKLVAIYGSAAAGDRTRRFSDVNLIVILERADSAVLSAIAPSFARWIKAGNKPPIVMLLGELRRSQDVFPIELGDIRDRHRLLHGDPEILTSISTPPAHLRRQLEFELRSKIFLLRQAFLESRGRSGAVEEAMARSMSSVAALFRGILRLAGDKTPATTPEVLRAVEARVPIDAEAWQTVWRLREGERWPAGAVTEQIFDRLLAGLQNAANFVDAHSAS